MSGERYPAWIRALLDPGRYPHPVDQVEVVETHISWVLLAGAHAYKFKKPVDFGFVDFTTLERRRFYCREELRRNQPLAAELYEAIIAVCGASRSSCRTGSVPITTRVSVSMPGNVASIDGASGGGISQR